MLTIARTDGDIDFVAGLQKRRHEQELAAATIGERHTVHYPLVSRQRCLCVRAIDEINPVEIATSVCGIGIIDHAIVVGVDQSNIGDDASPRWKRGEDGAGVSLFSLLVQTIRATSSCWFK